MITKSQNHIKTQNYIDAENKVCAHNYHPIPAVLHRGEGVYLYDIEGNKYLDMMSAYSAVSHGHSHPELLKTLKAQADNLCITSRAFHSDTLVPFCEKICEISGLDMVLPMNTGAEAVETAIKASRRWGYQVKKIPKNQAEIIVATQNFHGRTTTIVGFSTDEVAREDFGPFTPGFKQVPFGDAEALRNAITPNTCAILFEPIQGEAGIIIPPKGFLKEVRKICDDYNVLMIMDEIQSGLARTGKMFAFQHENIMPDGLILGKSLGGGIMPVSAFVAKKEIMSLFTPGSHGSTFGGNPLAAAIGLRALELIEELNLVENSASLGRYFKQQIEALNSPAITEIREAGLWIGVDFNEKAFTGRAFCEKLRDHGILSKDTKKQTIRLAPPLIITKAQIDFAIDKMKLVLTELS